jgi:chaperonin GroEL
MEFLQKNPKYNPQRMVTELQELYDTVIVPFLSKNAKRASGPEELIQVATISANGDSKIAAVAVEAVMKAGDDGTVLIEEAQGNQLSVESMDGYIVVTGLKDLGQIGPAFINDKAGQQAKMDKGVVFLYDGTMNDLKVPAAIQSAVEGTELFGKPILVFAHGFSDVVTDKFAKSTKNGYMVVPVKTPMSGVPNSQSSFLQDMAAYTGATVYDPGTVDKFIESDEDEGLGSFESAKVNMYETFVKVIINPEAVENRVMELKAIAETAPSEFDRMHIRAAISKLTGGVSTIKVGAGSELEIREKKARVEDAVESVRSAIAEGVLPGGCGVHLVLADMILKDPNVKQSWSIMASALRAPFELLLSNCGEEVSDVWAALEQHIVNRNTPPEVIFDAKEHKIVEPLSAGIIEPAKVVRVSVGNALSVASLLITLGGIVVSPRDSQLETQLELSKQAFRDMMSGGGVGAE